MSSFLLTKELAERAVGLVIPTIKSCIEYAVFKRSDLHIVVLDPTIPFAIAQGGSAIELPVIYEWSYGDLSKWEHPYHLIARSKAMISWRTGLPTHQVQQRMPYLLMGGPRGDTVYWGSAVLEGIIVAASGVQPWFDEMISYQVAAACRALCIAERVLVNKELDFLG